MPFRFCSLHSLLRLHATLVRHKLESFCALWNAITCIDATKLERIHRKFATVPYGLNRLFPASVIINQRRHHRDALFFVDLYYCTFLLGTAGLWFATRNARMSAVLTVIFRRLDAQHLQIWCVETLIHEQLDNRSIFLKIFCNSIDIVLLRIKRPYRQGSCIL
jgi:hypothetical protein